ncbi:MAG: LysM peptidoglycan-binding domain-containing protein [Pseudomonadota bacterium]
MNKIHNPALPKPWQRAVLPSVIALIFAGASAGANALELGDATVRSAFGEKLIIELPLRDGASVPTPCIQPELVNLKNVGVLRLERRADAVILRSNRVIRDPVIELRVTIDCPNVLRLRREYTLFVDPAPRVSDLQRQISAPARTQVARRRVPVSTPAAAAPRSLARQASAAPITGTEYVVRSGDTVSEIASRYKDSEVDLWTAVDAIVAANPHAFVNGDANWLAAGATLALPLALAKTQGPVAIQEPVIDPPPAPVTPTPAAAPASVPSSTVATGAPVKPASAFETEALLSVLRDAGREDLMAAEQNAAASEPAASADTSPFKEAEPVDTTPAVPVELAPAGSVSWVDRFVGVAVGVAAGIALWMLWQILTGLSARRRRVAATSRIPVVPVRDDMPAFAKTTDDRNASSSWRADVSAPAQKPAAPSLELTLDLDTEEHLAELDLELSAPAPSAPAERRSQSAVGRSVESVAPIEVQEFAPLGQGDEEDTIEQSQSAVLDDATQELLERDYEEQLTRTQQIQKELAEKALGLEASPVPAMPDFTERLPVAAETPDLTLDLTLDDEATLDMTLATAAPADFTSAYGEVIDDDKTESMPADLDIDHASVSAILRSAADDLAKADLDDTASMPGNDAEVDVESDDYTVEDDTASLRRKQAS